MGGETYRAARTRIARQIFIAVGVFATVIFLATTAYYLDGWKLGDAFYMVIITAFSVGFEEVEPVVTLTERTITILTILAGNSAAVYVVGSLIKVITEGEIQKAMSDHRKQRNRSDLKGHTVICGFGRIGQTVAHELKKANQPFVVVDREPERVQLAETYDYLTLEGDGGDEAILSQANIEKANALAAVLPNDTVNVFITLTARNMNPSLRILARAENPATEKKLRQAGANDVIMPAFSGGVQIAHRITRPSLMGVLQDSSQLLRFDLQELGVDLEEILIPANSHFDGALLADFFAVNQGRTIVLAIQSADGHSKPYPSGDTRLKVGDRIIAILRKTREP